MQHQDVAAHTKWLKPSASVSATKQTHKSIIHVESPPDSNNAVGMPAAMTTDHTTPVEPKSSGQAIQGDSPPLMHSRKRKAFRMPGTQSSSDQQQASLTEQYQPLQGHSLHQAVQSHVSEKDTAVLSKLHDQVPSKLPVKASTQRSQRRMKLIQSVLHFGTPHAQSSSQTHSRASDIQSMLTPNTSDKAIKQKVEGSDEMCVSDVWST